MPPVVSPVLACWLGKLGNVTIGSYYEGDFLGGGSTSNDNESNSYVFRQRQFWGQAKFDNGFTVTGGQMWSLVTETGTAMDNRTEQTPLTIDPQYSVGFSWARQYGMRFTKSFWDNKLTFGLGIEEAQTTFTVHGNPTGTITSGQTTVLVPTSATCPVGPCTALVGGTTTTYTNFLLGQAGVGGGLYNPLANYSYNPAPDIIVKAALDAFGGHYEVFGIVSQFRDRIFPCVVGVSVTTPCPIDGSPLHRRSARLTIRELVAASARMHVGISWRSAWTSVSTSSAEAALADTAQRAWRMLRSVPMAPSLCFTIIRLSARYSFTRRRSWIFT